jgi:hypothetical protein
MPGEQVRELRQLVLDLFEARTFLDGDVEEGARVAGGGGSATTTARCAA